MGYLGMNEVQGKFRVATDDTYDELVSRLKKPKSPKFIIIDSFQVADWDYPHAVELMEQFPKNVLSGSVRKRKVSRWGLVLFV